MVDKKKIGNLLIGMRLALSPASHQCLAHRIRNHAPKRASSKSSNYGSREASTLPAFSSRKTPDTDSGKLPPLLARQRLDQNQLSLPSQPPVFPVSLLAVYSSKRPKCAEGKDRRWIRLPSLWGYSFHFHWRPLHARFRRAAPSSGRFLGADRKTT